MNKLRRSIKGKALKVHAGCRFHGSNLMISAPNPLAGIAAKLT
jgi:hypothetical protein